MSSNNFISFLVFFVLNASVFGQTEGDKAKAQEDFKYGHWKSALSEYEELLKTDKKNPEYNYRIGICYMQLYVDRRQAAKYISAAIQHGTFEKRAPFMLAKAYHLSYQFEKAIDAYRNAIQTTGDKDLIARANRYMEMCEDAPKMIKDSLGNIIIENAGDKINSEAPDYFPYVMGDESTLYFNSKRKKGNNGYDPGNGFYTANIFTASDRSGEWLQSKSLVGTMVTPDVDEITGMSTNGKYVIINRINNEIRDDLFLAKKVGKRFSDPVLIALPINTSNKEYSGSISKDGKLIYFSSDRNDGKGGMDIYQSKMLPTGEWGLSEPLTMVNTEWDELHPHLSNDGSKLYFASEGHVSMGGFDIFVCEWDSVKSTWGTPKNVGYPINNVEDNYLLSFTDRGRVAYTSGYRADTKGGLDIYKITFLDVETRSTAFVGNIFYVAPVDYSNFQDFRVYEKDGKTQRFMKDYAPDPSVWKFVKKEKKEVKPGYKYVLYATFDFNGTEKTFAEAKIPQGNPDYKFTSASIKLVPIKNYKPIPKSAPKEIEIKVKNAFIRVRDKSGEIFGEYVPSQNTGRYVVILPEDEEFTLTLKSDNFEDYVQKLSVISKSSYRKIVKTDIILKPIAEPKKVHYMEVYDQIKKKL